MSVDTNVKGKNLSPYRRMRHADFKILVAPQLVGLAHSMRIDASTGFRKKFVVEFAGDDNGAACEI